MPGAVGSTWKRLREITYFFYGIEDKCAHVGVYASRPASMRQGGTMWEAMNDMRIDDLNISGRGHRLVVEFEDFEILRWESLSRYHSLLFPLSSS